MLPQMRKISRLFFLSHWKHLSEVILRKHRQIFCSDTRNIGIEKLWCQPLQLRQRNHFLLSHLRLHGELRHVSFPRFAHLKIVVST